MCHLAVFFGTVVIAFVYYLYGSKNFGTMTTPVHTSSMCRLTVRQADRRRAQRAWEGQMFPCRHGREMFAWLSTESQAGCPLPRAGVC